MTENQEKLLLDAKKDEFLEKRKRHFDRIDAELFDAYKKAETHEEAEAIGAEIDRAIYLSLREAIESLDGVAEVKAWLSLPKRERFPYPTRVFEIKQQSGLTWGAIDF